MSARILYDNSWDGPFREHYIGMLRGRLDALLPGEPVERYGEIVKEGISHINEKIYADND